MLRKNVLGCFLPFLLVIACSPHKGKTGAPAAEPVGSALGDSLSGDVIGADSEGGDIKSLDTLPNPGSKMRFLNGRALTTIYGRVFPKDEWGYAHCEKEKPADFDGCNFIFSAEERPSMGFFDLYSPRMHRGNQNVAITENLTLNYMRNLRAALGRECDRLVSREEKALSDDASTATLIVKSGGPTVGSLETFFRKILDVEGVDLPLDLPFEDFVRAYQAAVAMDSDKEKATHNASVNLCLSLAMDPQVYLY